MIKLKPLLLELSDGAKKQFIDKVRKLGYDLTDDQFKYYIDIFDKRKDNKVFPSKDIFSYAYDKDIPQKNQYTFKYLENLIDQNFSQESDIKYDVKNADTNTNDIIYNENGITIWDADTKEKCIKYGKYGNGYCVARTDSSNMFNSYRYKSKLTFYFIMDKNKKDSDPFSFFSIAVPDGINPSEKNKDQYYLTDKNNSINKLKSWNFIIQNNENIKDLQDLFKSKKLSDAEYERYNKFRYSISGNEYKNLNYDDKVFYIQMGHQLTENMFFNSNSRIQEIYILTGQSNIEEWYDRLGWMQKRLVDKTQNAVVKVFAERGGWKYDEKTKTYFADQNVFIDDRLIFRGKLLVNFSKVDGHFTVFAKNLLKTLEGSPREVTGKFNCSSCTSLVTLEGAPITVGGDFECTQCSSLISLKGSPRYVGGTFNCTWCKSLKTLEGSPNEVVGSFNCSKCPSLITLKGAPDIVGGSFRCIGCDMLESLEGSPKKINVDYFCYDCSNLISLEGSPITVSGNFSCTNTPITSLKGSPRYVGGIFDCSECKLLTTLEGSPKKISLDFYCYGCTSLTSLKHLPDAATHKIPKFLNNELQRILQSRGEM